MVCNFDLDPTTQTTLASEKEAAARKKVANSIFASIAAAKAKNNTNAKANAAALVACKQARAAKKEADSRGAPTGSGTTSATKRSFRRAVGVTTVGVTTVSVTAGGSGSGGGSWIGSKRAAIERDTRSAAFLNGEKVRLPRSPMYAIDRPVSDFLADLGLG
jgi:hypothetical protein